MGRKAATWHRPLMGAVKAAQPRFPRSVWVVAEVLCDLSKHAPEGVVFGGTISATRRTAAYNGGRPLHQKTVISAIAQLRRRGLLQLAVQGGRGRPHGAPFRGGRGDANGYVLAPSLGVDGSQMTPVNPGLSTNGLLESNDSSKPATPPERVYWSRTTPPDSRDYVPRSQERKRAAVSRAEVVHRGRVGPSDGTPEVAAGAAGADRHRPRTAADAPAARQPSRSVRRDGLDKAEGDERAIAELVGHSTAAAAPEQAPRTRSRFRSLFARDIADAVAGADGLAGEGP